VEYSKARQQSATSWLKDTDDGSRIYLYRRVGLVNISELIGDDDRVEVVLTRLGLFIDKNSKKFSEIWEVMRSCLLKTRSVDGLREPRALDLIENLASIFARMCYDVARGGFGGRYESDWRDHLEELRKIPGDLDGIKELPYSLEELFVEG